MKKALLLALATLLASAAPALAYPPVPANVNFTSERGLPFGLVLDGRPLTRGVARQVHVDQLVPGQHWADFSVPTAYGGALRFRRRVWLEPGVETSFVLVARPGWPLDLRQVSAVALYGPGHHHGYSGSGYDDDDDDECEAYNSPPPYGAGPGYPAGSYPSGSSYNHGSYPNGNNNGNYPTGNSGSNGYPNGNSGNYPNNGGYPNNGPGNHAPDAPGYPGSGSGYYPGTATSSYRTLPAPEVTGLLQSVQHASFDDDKLRTAKQGLAQGAVSADDLKRLLQALDFEASRVDLAKFGYAHLTDQANFERALDGLQFETSRQEVEESVSPTPRN